MVWVSHQLKLTCDQNLTPTSLFCLQDLLCVEKWFWPETKSDNDDEDGSEKDDKDETEEDEEPEVCPNNIFLVSTTILMFWYSLVER